MKWICGFANAYGGRIYIGVRDDGAVVGVSDSKKLMEDIPNKIRDTMGIVADVDLLERDGKEYIEIRVSPSSYPVNFRGEYHYRSGSTKQQLTGIALSEFIMRKTGAQRPTPLPAKRSARQFITPSRTTVICSAHRSRFASRTRP